MLKKFVLIDAHSIIYRSYYAFINNPLKNSKGLVTSGIFGFLNTLEKIKQKIGDQFIGLAFDAPGKTFRDEVYEEYKATRPPTPEDLPFQVAKVKEICKYLGIARFELKGYEADDILATFANRLKNEGEVYIVTSDKDLMQLVSDNVFMYDAYKDLIYDPEQVLKKLGVPPDRVGDYLALTGDNIDNIPGVPGIGPRRAVTIIKKYENFEQALIHDRRITAHKEQATLSRKLVELEYNVPIDIKPDGLLVHEPDIDRLMPILFELELHSYIKLVSASSKSSVKTQTIQDLTNISIAKIAGVSLGQDNEFYICPDGKNVYKAGFSEVKSIVNNKKIIKVGYNLKEFIKNCPIALPFFDTGIATWLIDPNLRSYKFEDIVLHNLKTVTQIDPASIARFSFQLYPRLRKKLDSQIDLYEKVERPLIPVLARMEIRGIKINIPYFEKLSREFNVEIAGIEQRIHKLANTNFNINSPKQLARILFEDLGLTPIKKGKSHYSTSVEVLEQLGQKHELPREILRFREYTKIKSTYLDAFIALAKNSRIHTTFNQTGTSTGRLSSSNPNIQNIPIRTPVGRRIRQGFIPEQGFVLVSADYSQIELRLLAHITGDKTLLNAFEQQKDIHQHTASLIFDIPEKDVDDAQRRMAKVVNYGLIYGMSEFGLAHRLDISHEQAAQFVQAYYDLYSGVAEWRDQIIETAEKQGYVETLLGRQRPLPHIRADNRALREFTKRAAINTPVQGSAADLIKLAMIKVEKDLQEQGFKQGLLLSIHDELVFEIEKDRLDQARSIIQNSMEKALELRVPIKVVIQAGNNWDEAH